MTGADAGNEFFIANDLSSVLLANAKVVLSAIAQMNVVIEFFMALYILILVFVLFNDTNLTAFLILV